MIMAKKLSILAVLVAILAAWLLFGSQKDAASAASGPTKADQPAESATKVTTEGGPNIEFPETTHDFGIITQNATVTHTFVVINTGDEPLELKKARAS